MDTMPENIGAARALLEAIGDLGYAVEVTGGDGRLILTATDRRTGEVYRIRSTVGDAYAAAAELAEQTCLAPEDG